MDMMSTADRNIRAAPRIIAAPDSWIEGAAV